MLVGVSQARQAPRNRAGLLPLPVLTGAKPPTEADDARRTAAATQLPGARGAIAA